MKSPALCPLLLLGVIAQRVAQVSGAGGCEIELWTGPLWWGTGLIHFDMDIQIIGLREVSSSGKSFGMDVE